MLSTSLEIDMQALDFSDDLLARLLDYLVWNEWNEEWEERFECHLNGNILRIYNLKTDKWLLIGLASPLSYPSK